MSTAEFWELDRPQFQARVLLHTSRLHRWAYEQATFHNAHFQTDGAPWMPEDFLGGGNREARLQQAKRDQNESNMLNAKLAQIERTKGKGVKGIPFWAQGEKFDVPEGVTNAR